MCAESVKLHYTDLPNINIGNTDFVSVICLAVAGLVSTSQVRRNARVRAQGLGFSDLGLRGLGFGLSGLGFRV